MKKIIRRKKWMNTSATEGRPGLPPPSPARQAADWRLTVQRWLLGNIAVVWQYSQQITCQIFNTKTETQENRTLTVESRHWHVELWYNILEQTLEEPRDSLLKSIHYQDPGKHLHLVELMFLLLLVQQLSLQMTPHQDWGGKKKKKSTLILHTYNAIHIRNTYNVNVNI